LVILREHKNERCSRMRMQVGEIERGRGKKYKHNGSEWQAMKQVVGCGDDDDDDGGGEGEDDEAEDAG